MKREGELPSEKALDTGLLLIEGLQPSEPVYDLYISGWESSS
jgi:hypothetical protein